MSPRGWVVGKWTQAGWPGYWPRRRGRHLARVWTPPAGGAVTRPEAAVRRAHCLPDEHLVRNTESSTWLSFAQKPLLGSESLLYLKIFSEWT